MTRQEIAQRRLHNQFLWGTPCESPEDTLGRLGAMQAQEFAYARWSVAQRTRGDGAASVDQAFAGGTILRTHALRPTWHFVLPADIRWILRLTAPRVNALNGYTYREFGLDEAVFAKSNTLFVKALEGGRQLTRTELTAVLHEAGIAAKGIGLACLLMRAELDAIICSGAMHGKQHTYALLDERVPRAKSFDRDEALAELTRRYFTSRGPATVQDFLRWSSLTAADARNGIAMVKQHLEHEEADGRIYWFAVSAQRVSRASPVIDLIQGYDEYVMSYSESKDILFGQAAGPEVAPYTHAILLDGQLIGHWKHVFQKDVAIIETSLYRRLRSAEKQALEAAVERYGRFLGMPVKCG